MKWVWKVNFRDVSNNAKISLIVKNTRNSMKTVPFNKRLQNMFTYCNDAFYSRNYKKQIFFVFYLGRFERRFLVVVYFHLFWLSQNLIDRGGLLNLRLKRYAAKIRYKFLSGTFSLFRLMC